MANVLIYDPNDASVANRVTAYYISAHTPDYNVVTHKIINPNVDGVSGVSTKHWKVSGSPPVVVEMTPSEKIAVDNLSPPHKRQTHNLLTFSKSTRRTSWTRVEMFVYEGSDAMGVPHQIEAICYADSGATGELRIFDQTNGNVLGTATITNTSEDKIDVAIINDWPNDTALVEIQAKRTSGTSKKKIYLNGMIIGF